jgi:hypothetical protein
MPLEMVMQRNRIVRSLSGHTIAFEKGKPILVQDAAVKECVQAGAVRADGEELPETVVDELDEVGKKIVVPPAGLERKKMLLSFFKAMQLNQEAHRTHFTAAGRPRSNYVSQTLGFDVPAQEIEGLWNEMIYPSDED